MMNAKLVSSPVLAAFLLVASGGHGFGREVQSPVKSDETVTFYTSAAWPSQEAGKWEGELHGIIFEVESRPLVAMGLSRALGLEPDKLTAGEQKILHERLKYFLADNERGKKLPVTIAGTPLQLPGSEPNGHFRKSFSLAAEPGSLAVSAVLRKGDPRHFTGIVLQIPDTAAPMVVSDLDDTIKVTNVRDRGAALMNTFCRAFEEVPGMASVYRRWAAEDEAAFHYVSGSPWQLYTPLEEFATKQGFPAGAWHLKHLRLADPESLVAFLGPQQEYKLGAIRPLLQRWPKRRFVLVGDTGEQDPEIYARLAMEHPDRIERIFLRNVTGETRGAPRMVTAFQAIPAAKWMLFEKAEELPWSLKP